MSYRNSIANAAPSCRLSQASPPAGAPFISAASLPSSSSHINPRPMAAAAAVASITPAPLRPSSASRLSKTHLLVASHSGPPACSTPPLSSPHLTLWGHLTQAPHTPLPPLHHPDNAAVGRQPVQQSQGLGRRGRHGSCILPRSVLAKRPLTYGIGSQDSNRWMRVAFTSKNGTLSTP